ncbi:MAG: hypothetical protein ACLQGP_04270 [Isosphaeraceae bacterium]
MPDRTREILEDLEAVRENRLALSDEIWRSIDHNDPEAKEDLDPVFLVPPSQAFPGQRS